MIRYSPQKNGFTLLEVLVAVTIIVVLSAVGIASYGNVNRRSRDARRTSDIEQIRQSLEMYRSDNGYYPAASGSLVPTYTPALPVDPKNSTQPYTYSATNNSGGNFYGYCVCAKLETTSTMDSTCGGGETAGYTYCRKSP